MTTRRKNLWCQLTGIAVCLIFSFLLAKDEVGMSGNESGRFAVMQAIGEQQVFYIEKTNFRSVDRLVRNYHVYYDKTLAPSWVAGLIYRPIHQLTGLNFFDNYYFLVYMTNLITGAVVNALIFLGMYHLLHPFRRGREVRALLLALGTVFSTWIFSYSVTLNSHNLAALAILGLFIALRRCRGRNQVKIAVLSGLLAGAAGAADWAAGGFAALGLLTFAVTGKFRGKFLLISAGCGLLVLLGLLGLNYAAYGNIMPLYIIDGQGTFQLGTGQKSMFTYAFDVLVGIRGFFSYMPFLLLAFWSFPYQKTKRFDRAAAVMCGAFFLFYIWGTNEYGGASYGFRYLIPTIPLFYYYAARKFFNLSFRGQGLVAALLLWGVVTSYIGTWQPFCVGFEGHRTPVGHFSREVKSSFGGNLLGYLYQHHHDSVLTQSVINYYGRRAAGLHLFYSFYSIKDFKHLAQIRREFPELNFK